MAGYSFIARLCNTLLLFAKLSQATASSWLSVALLSRLGRQPVDRVSIDIAFKKADLLYAVSLRLKC